MLCCCFFCKNKQKKDSPHRSTCARPRPNNNRRVTVETSGPLALLSPEPLTCRPPDD